MAISIIIQNEKKVYDAARKSALRQGTTLVTLIEKLVAAEAKRKVREHQMFIHEADAEQEIWCGSRATLYNLRKTKELKLRVHYLIREGLIFYKYLPLKKHFEINYPHIQEANEKRLERRQRDLEVGA